MKGFCIKGRAAELSKNVLQNEYALRIVPSLGGRGMTWMKVTDGRLESNIVQFFGENEQRGLLDRFGGQEGDVLIMVADPSQDAVHRVLGRLRLHMAERLGLIPQDRFSPLWVTDFPLFEVKEEGLGSQHHPFTMPEPGGFRPGKPGRALGPQIPGLRSRDQRRRGGRRQYPNPPDGDPEKGLQGPGHERGGGGGQVRFFPESPRTRRPAPRRHRPWH